MKRFQLLLDRHEAAEDKLDKRAGVEWKEVEKATNEDEMFTTMQRFADRRKHLPS